MSGAIALSIAGSDSGGGAGVQADLRVFAAHGVFGTTAITAVTAQNPAQVSQVLGLEAGLVQAQILAVTTGFPLTAVKTGMLWSAENVEAVALTVPPGLPLVVDPVMVATSGARLLAEPAVAVYRQMLCPRATLVTPNLDEAAVLLGEDDIPPERLFDAASVLADRLGCAVLLKGGHLRGDPLDVLRHPGGTAAWRHPRIGQVDTHGSGCMLSAAVAAQLARGHELVTACEAALAFVHRALEHGRPVAPGLRLADIEAAGRLAGEGGSSPLQRLQ